MTRLLHVAAAAIFDGTGTHVLLARRPDDKHQGGKWEFPGGKVEAGEDIRTALARELDEELGIAPTRARPLIRVTHHYPERSVLLDVWRVEAFHGEPHGREGQPVEWVPVDELAHREFPPANRPIVRAVTLPDRYLITPDLADAAAQRTFLDTLASAVGKGIELVQLRLRAPTDRFVHACLDVVHAAGARLLLNGTPEKARQLGADGVHLRASLARACAERPLPADMLVGVSCHDANELAHAVAIGADFAVLSPVNFTPSHPDVPPLGWVRFHALADEAALPVYALGGVGTADMESAWASGAQGIAAIRGLWSGHGVG